MTGKLHLRKEEEGPGVPGDGGLGVGAGHREGRGLPEGVWRIFLGFTSSGRRRLPEAARWSTVSD